MSKQHWAQKLKDENEGLKTDVASYKEKYLRALADLENYKKRVDKDLTSRADVAALQVLGDLLPVLGNFRRALLQENTNENHESFRKGVEMIYSQLLEVLGNEGLAPFSDTGGPFDPEIHEAISLVETEDHPEGTVLDVLEQGYYYRGKILRPAKVAVATPVKNKDDRETTSVSGKEKGGK
jgi:molecular chaperone GrpE